MTGNSKTRTDLSAYYHVANLVPFACGSPQKKGINPDHQVQIKSVKGVSCVDQLSSVKYVTNVPTVAPDLPVGARLQQFWKKMGRPRHEPQSSNNPQGRLHSTLLIPAKFDQVTKHHKLLCKSPQEPLPVGGIASAFEQNSQTGNKSNISGLLQLVVLSLQIQQLVETYTGPEQLKQIPKDRVIQNGDSRDNTVLPADRGVGDLNRLHRHILPYTNPEPVKEVYAFHIQGSSCQSKALPFGLSTDPMEFTVEAKEVKFLVPRLVTHETNPMAFEKQLEGTGVIRPTDISPQVSPPTFKVVTGERQCTARLTFTPTKTCSANLYRRIKRRMGNSLKRAHCKGNLVSSKKPITHKLSGAKSSPFGVKTVPGPLPKQDSTHSNRQHHSGCLFKQGAGDEVRPLMCPSMENPDLVYQDTGDP